VHLDYIPYPATGYSSGDAAWQLTAATLVGLMSLPGLAVLYGGLVQKKWAVNTMLMAFSAFSLVLVVWALWAFNMGFGTPLIKTTVAGSGSGFVGVPKSALGAGQESQASIPLLKGLMPPFNFSQSALFYFQFVFAAITPLLWLGSVIGRMSFKAWLIVVPLWTTLVYSVDAFMLWGGGFWAGMGAVDYSGGYVIHLSAGTAGFVAAAVIGPRLKKDRDHGAPNNLLLCATGAGILWLGWNGFNGGDPYFAGADAAMAVVNTNLATALALLTWLLMDMFFSPAKKPTLLGSINGMIVGLVTITPAAGYVNGLGAICLGVISSAVVWLSWYKLSKRWIFKKVDDTLGVVYTHGIAGLCGGLLVGVFADPNVLVYLGANSKSSAFSVTGLLYGSHSLKQLEVQAGAALTVICWTALMTFLILKGVGLFVRLRLPDEQLETGDLSIHEEVVYPGDSLSASILDPVGAAAAGAADNGAEIPGAAGNGAEVPGAEVQVPDA
jgi:Amt family ammonium transporter